MSAEEITKRLSKGDTRYHGEWHLQTCQDDNAGVACNDDCSAERAALAELGVEVTCPDGKSWNEWESRLMVGVTYE